MNVVVLADRGRVRNSNQDIVFAENRPVGALSNLYIVANGTGGHRAGDYCSQILTVRVVSAMRESEGKLPLLVLRDAALLASENLLTEAKRHVELEGMGSTLVAAFLEEQSVTVLNIGDSRCYVGSADGSFRQVIRDYPYVEEMVSAGKMRHGSEAYKKSKDIIMWAIDINAEVQMDLSKLPVENLALLLLCTDGLTNMLENAKIQEIFSEIITPKEKAEKLIQAANMKGGRDNISVALVDLREEAGVQ